MVNLKQGDCLDLLESINDVLVDMVLTDPPYSSGGLFPGDRKKKTSSKYTDNGYNGASRFLDFSGDNMDQRSFTEFMRMVLAKCRKKTKPAGICAVFTDWRQLPSMTDALQAAGWIYRGIVVWDKGNSRAIPNRFRNDCEYIVWGTNGRRETKYETGVFVGAGCYHIAGMNSREKHHQTEKPIELLEKLVAIVPEGGTVMDCFMGSGSTGVACVNTGRDFIGMEILEQYFKVAQNRINEAMAQINPDII
ncbi:DNA-methyltransferase [Phocaeicola sartorii]|uniref:DNA-methyltransferase n=1 Tax=Phocaeicola sartorii TaxID=671267 RepID=UPI00272D0C12|nr:site-specific DNA-methyltransferase [Phocaeicola sartorii]